MNRDAFALGIDRFNRQAFFDSHEALEEAWREERGPDRLFLQGLIHAAVAMHHLQCGNRPGACRQFDKALRKLAGYLPAREGLDTLLLYRQLLAVRDAAEAGRPLPPPPRLERASAPPDSGNPRRLK